MNKTRRAGLCAPYLKIWQAFKRKENSIDLSWDVDWDKAEDEEKLTQKEENSKRKSPNSKLGMTANGSKRWKS